MGYKIGRAVEHQLGVSNSTSMVDSLKVHDSDLRLHARMGHQHDLEDDKLV